jgi:hypothetical protein
MQDAPTKVSECPIRWKDHRASIDQPCEYRTVAGPQFVDDGIRTSNCAGCAENSHSYRLTFRRSKPGKRPQLRKLPSRLTSASVNCETAEPE